jgi:hypothetical protein
MISKVYCKISVSLRLVQNLEILDLAMEKVEKFNITVNNYPRVELLKDSGTLRPSHG